MNKWAQIIKEVDVGGREMHEFTNMVHTWRRNPQIPLAVLDELKLLDKDGRKEFYAAANWLIKTLDSLHAEAEGL